MSLLIKWILFHNNHAFLQFKQLYIVLLQDVMVNGHSVTLNNGKYALLSDKLE